MPAAGNFVTYGPLFALLSSQDPFALHVASNVRCHLDRAAFLWYSHVHSSYSVQGGSNFKYVDEILNCEHSNGSC